MPPPPPPSASYLLVLESDSEDEVQERHVARKDHAVSVESNCRVDDNPSTPTSVSQWDNVMEDYNDDDDLDTSMDDPPLDSMSISPVSVQSSNSHGNNKLTKNQKRKLRRNKKKSKRENNDHHDITNVNSTKTMISHSSKVSFSNVFIRTYPRAFSEDSVPSDGGWPLGMELDNHHDEEPIQLEEFETCKQQLLKERWEALLEAHSKLPDSSSSLLL
jgi:hypothetical protein